MHVSVCTKYHMESAFNGIYALVVFESHSFSVLIRSGLDF